VTAWVDKINGYTLSQDTGANQPTISSINGVQAFDYNGSTQFLSSTDAGLVAEGEGASEVNPTTVFYVAEFDAFDPYFPVNWSNSTTSGGTSPIYGTVNIAAVAGEWRIFYRPGFLLVNNQTAETASTNTPYILSTTTGEDIAIFANGSELLSAENTASESPLDADSFSVGVLVRTTKNFHVDGKIGDVLVYNRVLTDAEREKVEQYLATKYGITLA